MNTKIVALLVSSCLMAICLTCKKDENRPQQAPITQQPQATDTTNSVASLSIEPVGDSFLLKEGDTLKFDAIAKNKAGQTLANKFFAWGSSDTAVASVENGTVHGKKGGYAAITVTSESKIATVVVTVEFKEYFRGKVDGIFFSDSAATTSAFEGTLDAPGRGTTTISGHYGNGLIYLSVHSLDIGQRTLESDSDRLVFSISPYSGGKFYAASPFYNNAQGSGKINVLEKTVYSYWYSGGYIKGTFEGILPADSTVAIFPPIIITEGEFKLRWLW